MAGYQWPLLLDGDFDMGLDSATNRLDFSAVFMLFFCASLVEKLSSDEGLYDAHVHQFHFEIFGSLGWKNNKQNTCVAW